MTVGAFLVLDTYISAIVFLIDYPLKSVGSSSFILANVADIIAIVGIGVRYRIADLITYVTGFVAGA